MSASWNGAHRIANRRLTNSFIARLTELPKFNKAMEDWNDLPKAQQTWAKAQAHFKEASQKLQRHGQQTADAHGFGNAYNATQVDDDNSIASTIADMNIKHAETLEAFSELSQSNHATQSKNLALENEVATLKAQLQQLQIHSANASMGPPPTTPHNTYIQPAPQYYQQQQYAPPQQQYYNPPPQQYQQNNNNGYGYNNTQNSGNGRGRRGGRGGRREGRSNNNNSNNNNTNNQPTYNPPSQQQQNPYAHYYNTSGGYQHAQQYQQRTPNPRKYHQNMWYCHSCGFDVDHSGQNCNNRRPYHQAWITREQARQFMKDDRWVGCRKGEQKNQWADGSPTGECID